MKLLNLNNLPLIRHQVNPHFYGLVRFLSQNNSDYQYIMRSNMNSYYFQKSLPRLPIPKIEKTLERYLAAQRPILTNEEFKVTKEACDKFVKAGNTLNSSYNAIR